MNMKCSDLQIGDYVRFKRTKETVWVFEIDGDRNVINNEPDGYCSEKNIDIDDVEPIPLTPEILRKNGFQVDGYAILNLQDGKWLEYYFHEHRFSMYYEGIDEWQNHSQVRDIVHRSQPFYVHELQHSLRLCGLNDLADHFKIEE